MEPLPHPEPLRVRAAEGWLELGDHLSASAELDAVDPLFQQHPLVLMTRWQVYAKSRQWSAAYEIAEMLIDLAPEESASWIDRSYVLHEMKRTAEAWDKLLPAVTRFPKDPIIAYNLACYACQLGRREEALGWLQRAMVLGDRQEIEQMSRTDPDLAPLWENSSKLPSDDSET